MLAALTAIFCFPLVEFQSALDHQWLSFFGILGNYFARFSEGIYVDKGGFLFYRSIFCFVFSVCRQAEFSDAAAACGGNGFGVAGQIPDHRD